MRATPAHRRGAPRASRTRPSSASNAGTARAARPALPASTTTATASTRHDRRDARAAASPTAAHVTASGAATARPPSTAAPATTRTGSTRTRVATAQRDPRRKTPAQATLRGGERRFRRTPSPLELRPRAACAHGGLHTAPEGGQLSAALVSRWRRGAIVAGESGIHDAALRGRAGVRAGRRQSIELGAERVAALRTRGIDRGAEIPALAAAVVLPAAAVGVTAGARGISRGPRAQVEGRTRPAALRV